VELGKGREVPESISNPSGWGVCGLTEGKRASWVRRPYDKKNPRRRAKNEE